MPRNVTLQDDTQFATVYVDNAREEPLLHIERARVLSHATHVWTAFDLDGGIIRRFTRTQYLVNWLIKIHHVRIDCRPIDSINAMILEANS